MRPTILHCISVDGFIVIRGWPSGRSQAPGESAGDGPAVVIGGLTDPADQGKVILVAAFGKDVIGSGLQPSKFIGGSAKFCGGGGGGGGCPNLAQAGGRDGAALSEALQGANQDLIAALSSS